MKWQWIALAASTVFCAVVTVAAYFDGLRTNLYLIAACSFAAWFAFMQIINPVRFYRRFAAWLVGVALLMYGGVSSIAFNDKGFELRMDDEPHYAVIIVLGGLVLACLLIDWRNRS